MSSKLTLSDVEEILGLTPEALDRARELFGVTSAHREAYSPVRAARLEVAEAQLLEALARHSVILTAA